MLKYILKRLLMLLPVLLGISLLIFAIMSLTPGDPARLVLGSYATEDDLACIQSVKVKTMDGEKGSSIEREVKLNDKMKALELLGKHLGMFKDKIELESDMELNINIDYGD